MSRLIHLRDIADPGGGRAEGLRGDLTPLDVQDVPFKIKRLWFLHDIPEGAQRGGHAHRKMQELVVAVSGSFDVVTFGFLGHKRWHLNRASVGLYIPPNEWRYLTNFSSNAVALVVASTTYDAADYIRDMAEFRASLPPIGEDYFTRRAKAEHLWEVDR